MLFYILLSVMSGDSLLKRYLSATSVVLVEYVRQVLPNDPQAVSVTWDEFKSGEFHDILMALVTISTVSLW